MYRPGFLVLIIQQRGRCRPFVGFAQMRKLVTLLCAPWRRAKRGGWTRRPVVSLPFLLGVCLACAVTPVYPDSSGPAFPDTPDAFRASLARRRAASPPLETTLRILTGTGEDEDVPEALVTLRWSPLAPPARGDDALPDALRGLELPLLRPDALVIRELRLHVPPKAPAAPPPSGPPRGLTPFYAGRCRVVGPTAPWPAPPRMADEYDLARPSLTLVLEAAGSRLDAVVDPETLFVERLDWRGAGGRGTAIVEAVKTMAGGEGPLRPSLPATDPRPTAYVPPATPPAGSLSLSLGLGERLLPDSAAKPREPAPRDAPAGRLRVVERPSADPAIASMQIEGAASLPEGDVLECRVTIRGRDLERGDWSRELARCRCAVKDGRFAAALDVPRRELAAGRVEAAACRENPAVALTSASFAVPPEAWRPAMLSELKSAERALAALESARAVGPHALAAFARDGDWVFLPATRRGVDERLRERATGAAPDTGIEPLRGLLAREARWAVAERLAAVGPRPAPREREAVARLFPELPRAADGIDPALGALLEVWGAEAAAPPPVGAESLPSTWRPLLDALRDRLRRARP